MKQNETYLFVVTFLVAFIGIVHLLQVFVTVALVLSLCIYLFAGWYFLSPSQPVNKMNWIPLVTSFLVAQTLLVVIFGIQEWPLRKEFSCATQIAILVFTVVLISKRSSLPKEYLTKKLFVRLITCFMFAGAPLWMWI